YNLGASDVEAEHCLLLDREGRQIVVASLVEAKAILTAQHIPIPQVEPEARKRAPIPVQDLLNLDGWQETEPDPAAIRDAMRLREEAITRMLHFLDTQA